MWEKEKLLYPFPTLFSKNLYCRHGKTRAYLGKGQFFTKNRISTEPCSLVGSIQDLKKRGRWFNPQLGQYSFNGVNQTFDNGNNVPKSWYEKYAREIYVMLIDNF